MGDISPLESHMMHPDDIKRLTIMGTLIMLCAFCPGLAKADARTGCAPDQNRVAGIAFAFRSPG
jgi:hypothetical protein